MLNKITNPILCKCGCGKVANLGNWVIGHWNRGRINSKEYKINMGISLKISAKKGKEHYRWKGGKYKNKNYIYILRKEHPYCNKDGYVPEHRLIMEEKIGRYLYPYERVRHINNIRSDNIPGNLKLMSREEHLVELCKNNAKKASKIGRKIKRQNSKYVFMGCKFDSKNEMKFCRMLVKKKLINRPIEGKNVHFQVEDIEIDFFIQNKLFIEHRTNRVWKKYYIERRRILDKNSYKKTPLIIFVSYHSIDKEILPYLK